MFHTFTVDNLDTAHSHFMFVQLTALLRIFEDMNANIYGDACNYLWKCSVLCCSPLKYSTMELVVRAYGSVKFESLDVVVKNLDSFASDLEEYFFSPEVFEVVDFDDDKGKEIVIENFNPFDSLYGNDGSRIIIRVIRIGTMSCSYTCDFSDSLIVWNGSDFSIFRGDDVVIQYLESYTAGVKVDSLDACQMSGIVRKVAKAVFEEGDIDLINVECDHLETWLRLSEMCEAKGSVTVQNANWKFSLFDRALSEDGENKCAICIESLATMRVGKKINVIAETKCKHRYHLGCISRWLSRDENNEGFCPLCKKSIKLRGAKLLHNLF